MQSAFCACPICGAKFGLADLQKPAGALGGSFCPVCQGRLQLVLPFGAPIAIASLLFAVGALALLRVTSVIWFAVGAIIIWIPLSLFLNTWSTRFRPAVFKKWKPRRQTFFEWLYERDSTPSLFDKH